MIISITDRDKEIVKANFCELEDIEDKLFAMVHKDIDTRLCDVWSDLWNIIHDVKRDAEEVQ